VWRNGPDYTRIVGKRRTDVASSIPWNGQDDETSAQGKWLAYWMEVLQKPTGKWYVFVDGNGVPEEFEKKDADNLIVSIDAYAYRCKTAEKDGWRPTCRKIRMDSNGRYAVRYMRKVVKPKKNGGHEQELPGIHSS